MRWKIDPEPKEGDTRVVTKFAFFPIPTYNGYTVWLEKYEEYQEYTEITMFDGIDVYLELGWVIVKRMAIISALPWKD